MRISCSFSSSRHFPSGEDEISAVTGRVFVAKTPERFTYDAVGNMTEDVDPSSGEIAAHYDYGPFGETLVASGPLASTFTNRFSTKPYCQTTGFCEYQMRKYRAGIGRWMSRDPMEEDGGCNIYALCRNQ